MEKTKLRKALCWLGLHSWEYESRPWVLWDRRHCTHCPKLQEEIVSCSALGAGSCGWSDVYEEDEEMGRVACKCGNPLNIGEVECKACSEREGVNKARAREDLLKGDIAARDKKIESLTDDWGKERSVFVKRVEILKGLVNAFPSSLEGKVIQAAKDWTFFSHVLGGEAKPNGEVTQITVRKFDTASRLLRRAVSELEKAEREIKGD